jgi:transcriptional regulator with AAA-type ATPase domain
MFQERVGRNVPGIEQDALGAMMTILGRVVSGNSPQRVPSLAEVERNLIASVLENTRGNKVAAAELLGISHKKLYAKIAKYQLTIELGKLTLSAWKK